MAELRVNDLPPDPFPERPPATALVVGRGWAGVLLFDLVAAAAMIVLGAEVGRFAAGGAFFVMLFVYVRWVRRRVPDSPGRTAAAVVAGIGFVVLLVGVGYGTGRAYLAAFGRQGTAQVVSRQSSTERGGGVSYRCTVRLPDGHTSALGASSGECERQRPDPQPEFASRVPVVYDPSHVVDPMAGTRRQLGVAKTVAPAAAGLALIVLAAGSAVLRTAAARRRPSRTP